MAQVLTLNNHVEAMERRMARRDERYRLQLKLVEYEMKIKELEGELRIQQNKQTIQHNKQIIKDIDKEHKMKEKELTREHEKI